MYIFQLADNSVWIDRRIFYGPYGILIVRRHGNTVNQSHITGRSGQSYLPLKCVLPQWIFLLAAT